MKSNADASGGKSAETEWHWDVPTLLTLEQTGPDRFRCGQNQPNFQASIYGGQFLGQALAASLSTVQTGRLRSLHSYFLNAGDRNAPIDFEVERLRDSKISAVRRVFASQGEKRLFELQCLYRVPQSGFFHQFPMPDAPAPDTLESLADIARADPELLGEFGRFVINGQSVEVRPLSRGDLAQKPGELAKQSFWLRVPSAASVEDPAKHLNMLAYLSDYWFARVCLLPHRTPVPTSDYFFASIDHCMWMHGDARVDDWLLYDADSPMAGDGTGFTRGQIFDRSGRLVASTAQEVLQMPRSKPQ